MHTLAHLLFTFGFFGFVSTIGLAAGKPAKTSGGKEDQLSEAELKMMQEKIKQSDFMQVDFTQKFFTPLHNKTRNFSGHAYFAKPRKFRWDKKTPVREEMIYDGKDLYIYLPDEKRVTKYGSVGSQAKEFEKLTEIVLNADKLLDHYSLIEAKYIPAAKKASMQLEPKRSGTEVKKVALDVSYASNFVEMVKIFYQDGKEMTFNFQNPSTSPIDGTKFGFARTPDIRFDVFD